MSATCSRIDAYLDGGLSDSERATFESHLLGCAACQDEIEAGMQLAAAGAELAGRPDRPQAAAAARPRRSRRGTIAALAFAVSAVVAGLVIWRVAVPHHATPSLEDRVAAMLAPRRSMLARLPYAPLDRYRPYDAPRGAGIPEAISLKLAAEVEASRGAGALAAVLIARHDLDQAGTLLARSSGDEVEIARAALALARGKPEEALPHVDAVLASSPRSSVAAWNRALALMELDLPLSAAEMFDVVAASQEAGWSDEARKRAEQLRRAEGERKARWLESKQVCDALANGTIGNASVIQRSIAVCRPSFYEAVRVARTRDARLALAPIAEMLDAGTGSHAAADLVRRVADAPHRDAAVDIYLRLTRGNSTLDDAEKARLLAQLEASGNDDLVLGAIPRIGLPDLRAEYIERALATKDPYYVEVAHEREADELLTRGDALAAEALLLPLTQACSTRDVELRCQYLHFALATVYEALHRPARSREVVHDAFARSRRLALYWDERQLFDYMAEAARLELDHSQMRAYLREATLRSGGECAQERFALESLAEASIEELQFARARQELSAAPACGESPTIARLRVVAELAHVDGTGDDLAAARAGLARLRGDATMSAGERAQLDAIEGRLLAKNDPAAAAQLLRRAIESTHGASRSDVPAVKAHADAYASLIVLAAGGNDRAATLALFGEATGVQSSAPCVVGALVDAERVVVVAKTKDGALLQHFDPHGRRTAALDAAAIVPKAIRDAIVGCPRIDVLALPPVYGLPGLLPAELAWSYRSRSSPVAPARITSPTVLAVADPQPPRDLGFAPLDTASLMPIPRANHVELRGVAATPSRALASFPGADAIEVHAHGFVNIGASDAALIALSPDLDGKFTLSAQDIAGVPLPRSPLVVLAACHAAYTAPYRHESWGLPEAFLIAGARGVLATREAIPDRDAAAFFRGIEEAVLSGADPAVALRDARLRALATDSSSWAATVLLFD